MTLRGAGPLIPNVGGTGYYRFELPTAEWDKLIAAAPSLSGGEAQAFSDSLYASFRAGRANAAQLLAGAERLARNPDSYASKAGMDNLQGLFDIGLLGDTGEAGYRRLAAQIYAPQLKTLGFTPRAGAYTAEPPETSQQREQAAVRLVQGARDPELRARLAAAGRVYLAGDTKALDPAWFDLAFAVLLDEGGVEMAKTLAERALGSQDPVLRPTALGTVAGSGNPLIATWVLDSFTDKRLRRSERLGMIRAVIGSRGTRDLGFDWLKLHFDELAAGGGGIFFTAGLPGTVGGFCSVARADEIAVLLRPKLAGKTGALELERTVEQVRSCGLLREARGAELSAALAQVK